MATQPRYNNEQRLFCYTEKEKGTHYPQFKTAYLLKFGPPAPSKKAVWKMHKKITTHFTISDAKRSGRPKTGRSLHNVLDVLDTVMSNPTWSTTERAGHLQLPYSTVKDILKNDLHFTAYKITRHHLIKPLDYQKRIDFANTLLPLIAADRRLLDTILYTDEAHVELNGYINSQNARHWGSSRPNVVAQRQAHPQKVTIWAAISSQGLIGPYFFEDAGGLPVTVDGQRYLNMLQTHFLPDFQLLSTNYPMNRYFMQDGARAHILRSVITFITSVFGTRTFGEKLNVHWPARSPDGTPCDFFLWGWLKDRLYRRYPIPDRQTLKTHIVDILQNELTIQMCQNACGAVGRRWRAIRANGGRHIEHFFKVLC